MYGTKFGQTYKVIKMTCAFIWVALRNFSTVTQNLLVGTPYTSVCFDYCYPKPVGGNTLYFCVF